MKVNELRIGNWLQRLDGTFFQVVSSDFSIIENTPTYLTPKPIPITEEWLLKFGFKSNKLRIGTYELSVVLPNSAFYKECGFPCKHVHQLQNLYFALTGEELTIKET